MNTHIAVPHPNGGPTVRVIPLELTPTIMQSADEKLILALYEENERLKAASPPVLPPGWLDEAMKLAEDVGRYRSSVVLLAWPPAAEDSLLAHARSLREDAIAALRDHLKLAEVRGTAEPYTGEPK